MNEWQEQVKREQSKKAKQDIFLWIGGTIALIIVLAGLYIVLK